MLRVLLNWFKPNFWPLENILIDLLFDHLSSSACSVFKKQINLIKCVQRTHDMKEIHIYYKNNKKIFDKNTLFALNPNEFILASIYFSTNKNEIQVRSEFWVVNGLLFSIEFSHSPKEIDYNKITIKKTVIHNDPFSPEIFDLPKPLNTRNFQGWLFDWSNGENISNIIEPISMEKQRKILQQLDIVLPVEYIEIINQTNGFTINNCCVLGLDAVRSLIMPDYNYYKLAEINGRGVICIKRDSLDKSIYFLSFENRHPENLGFSFRAAIEKFIKK